ncbi:endonuclease/exonuclease/phosphatase family protein [Microvirga sp. GCM10011540]|uniref:endonuclease/exonuclease/phosphatase family protein n=1 Tax=Microvirga sp. GCM10011540 TaxID=3317338 RepID=UPI0036065C04
MPRPGQDLARAGAGRLAAPSVVLAALLGVATVASFLGAWWWLFDIASHFRPQLAAASLVCLATALFARSRAAAILCLVLVAANAVPLLPYLSGSARAAGAERADLRVLTLNLHLEGADMDAVRRLIASEDPDVVMFTEMPADDGAILAGLRDAYPHRTEYRRGSPFDVVLLSRWRIEDWSMDRNVAPYLPVLSARLCGAQSRQRCITIVGLHAARPFGREGRRQRAQLDAAAAAVRAAPLQQAVVMGDLNLTPWSHAFHRFTQGAGVRGNPPERGLAATWLSRVPLFGLMIDHVLASPNVRIVRAWVGADVGSDHLPVIADLAFEPEP